MVTHGYWSLDGDENTHWLVIAVYLVFCELLCLPWNILVLVTAIKQKLRRQPNIILLVNLIVTDLFIFTIPHTVQMTTGFVGEFILGSSDETRCILIFSCMLPL